LHFPKGELQLKALVRFGKGEMSPWSNWRHSADRGSARMALLDKVLLWLSGFIICGNAFEVAVKASKGLSLRFRCPLALKPEMTAKTNIRQINFCLSVRN